MPFTGWLAVISARLARQFRWTRLGTSDGPGQLERFLLTWFVVVFAFFSFSSTQLPHYVVYGCTPLFILLARHPLNVFGRWLAYLPLLIFALVIAGLPWLLPMAAAKAHRPLESMLLAGLVESFSGNGRWLLLALPLVVLGMALWRRLPVWQGLVHERPGAGRGGVRRRRAARHRGHPGAGPRGRPGRPRTVTVPSSRGASTTQLQRLPPGGDTVPAAAGRRAGC
jgi:hypothetical protein